VRCGRGRGGRVRHKRVRAVVVRWGLAVGGMTRVSVRAGVHAGRGGGGRGLRIGLVDSQSARLHRASCRWLWPRTMTPGPRYRWVTTPVPAPGACGAGAGTGVAAGAVVGVGVGVGVHLGVGVNVGACIHVSASE
jgi:hypothetical protein